MADVYCVFVTINKLNFRKVRELRLRRLVLGIIKYNHRNIYQTIIFSASNKPLVALSNAKVIKTLKTCGQVYNSKP